MGPRRQTSFGLSSPGALLIVGMSCLALCGAGLTACGSSSSAKPVDASAEHANDGGGGAGGGGGSDAGRDVPLGNDGPIDMGAGGSDAPTLLCQGVMPGGALISDFESGSGATFGQVAPDGSIIVGGTYISDALTEDFSANDWHLSGPISGNQHMGIYWTCSLPTTAGGCTLDASRYKGISFSIKGNAGPDNAITLSLGRAENDPMPVNAGCGSCVAPADAATDYCRGPRVMVPVTAAGATVTVLWTDFMDGSPHDSIDPHQLTGILWIFHDLPLPDGGTTDDAAASEGGTTEGGSSDASEAGTSTPDGGTPPDASVDADQDATPPPPPSYPGDITIDNIQFVSY